MIIGQPPGYRLLQLEVWAQNIYGDQRPEINTLRRWARDGKITPAPQKHGRQYFVVPDAVLVKSVCIRPALTVAPSDQDIKDEWGGLTPYQWFKLNKQRFYFDLPLIAEQRQHVGVSPPGVSGIYFLFLGDSLRYIGKSVHISNRIYQHRFPTQLRVWTDDPVKWFDHWVAIWVPEEHLERVERDYIWRIRPPRNVSVLPPLPE